jgi:hypothetical protein
MTPVEPIRILEEAKGDPALLALATVDLTYPELSQSTRNDLRTALEVAAVPHWCDAIILAGLLDISPTNASPRWDQLSALTTMEPFPARGRMARNVHEAARLAIRHRLADTDIQRLQLLSGCAASQFENDQRPAGRIEWLYHMLIAEPERAADELERASAGSGVWTGHHDKYALTTALNEVDEAGLLDGRLATWARVTLTRHRTEIEGAARFADTASDLLKQAEASQDLRLVAECQELVGEVAEARGNLDGAQAAYEQYLAILERLSAQDPTNSNWQRSLAVAQSRVADVARGRGSRRLPNVDSTDS